MALDTDFFKLVRAHPWHGLDIGDGAPREVTAYIELVPADRVRYRLDRGSGYLRVDGLQQDSDVRPTMYGLLPQTLSGEQVAKHCMEQTGRGGIVGDGDALDVCLLAEKPFPRGDCIVRALPVGGLRIVDGGRVDDKIIAVMESDPVYGQVREIRDCPQALVTRLRDYFLRSRERPDDSSPSHDDADLYGRVEAFEIIERGREDYGDRYSELARLRVQLR